MGRKRLINTDSAIALVDEYYAENPYKKITSEDISRLAASKGITIPGRVLRRNKDFINYLNETNDTINNQTENNNEQIVFRSLDIDSFLRKNNNIADLKKSLTLRDQYYEAICKRLNLAIKENKILKKEDNVLKNEQLEHYKQLTLKLKKFIERNINPSIANSLLAKEGLIEEFESFVVEPKVLEFKTKFEIKQLNDIARMFDEND